MADASKKKLEDFLKKIASEQDFKDCEIEVKPLSSGGANYSSQLFVGRISAPGKPDLKIFAKVAILDESFRSMMASNIYLTEQYFYSTIADIFKKLQDKYEVPDKERLKIPKMYGYDATEFSEVIVLEDLAAEGFAMHDRLQSVNWKYATAAVNQLARLHALSIALRLKHSLIMSTNDYEELRKRLEIDTFKFDAMLKPMKNSLEKSMEIIKEEYREAVRNYINNNFGKIMDFHKPLRTQVLVHGDFRTSNIMHKVEEDGNISLIPVDYQTLSFGSPIVDLMYFIFTGSDAEFRRWNFHPILDYYHDQLSVSLARMELDAAKLYPKHEFDRDLKQHLGLGLVFALFAIPVMTVDTDNAPKPDDKLSFDSLMSMTTSQLCSIRLNEVVDDYVAWGVL